MADMNEYIENLMDVAAHREEFEKQAGIGKGFSLRKLKNFLGKKETKIGVGSFIGWMALQKLIDAGVLNREQALRKREIESQAAMATPENLYYQASLPSAQAEEEQARQALFAQISGGILGPQLARGERLI